MIHRQIIVIYSNIIIYTRIKLVIFLDFDVNTSADLGLLTVSWVGVTILQGLNSGLQRYLALTRPWYPCR